jgi:hypothetical protein
MQLTRTHKYNHCLARIVCLKSWCASIITLTAVAFLLLLLQVGVHAGP